MAANSDTLDDDGRFPLLSAVKAQDVNLVRSLLDDGADADQAVVAGTAAPEGLAHGRCCWPPSAAMLASWRRC